MTEQEIVQGNRVQWEYHRLFINLDENWPDKLASVGERGWELVSAIAIRDSNCAWLIFKRQLLNNGK